MFARTDPETGGWVCAVESHRSLSRTRSCHAGPYIGFGLLSPAPPIWHPPRTRLDAFEVPPLVALPPGGGVMLAPVDAVAGAPRASL